MRPRASEADGVKICAGAVTSAGLAVNEEAEPIYFMKRITRSLLALSLPLMSLAPLSAALNSSIVSGDSQWVLHVDLNSLRDSTVGKEIVTQATVLQAEAMKGKQMPIQVDVPKLLATIGSITAYGANLSQDPNLIDGALIFQGTPDLRAIAEGVVAQATVTTPDMISELKDLPFEAYSVAGQLIVAFPKEPIILISKSKAQLLTALNVYRGDAPSLAKVSASPLKSLVKNSKGSFFLAASVVPSGNFFPENAPQARILQMAKSASVELGESSQQTFAHVQLLASSDDMADKLMKILQGMAAMASLAESSDQHLTEFLKSVAVTREKNTVTLRLAYSSERLVQMFRDLQQQKKQPRRQDGGVQRDVSTGPVPPVEGKVLLQWTADQQLGNMGVSPKTMVSQTIAKVPLSAGSVIVLTGHRDDGENARFDYVEITPADGGIAQRIEAEGMTLNNYTVLDTRHGSGGKMIQSHDSYGTARFTFAGADGVYTVTVRYVDENDGASSFFISTLDPQPESQPEKP